MENNQEINTASQENTVEVEKPTDNAESLSPSVNNTQEESGITEQNVVADNANMQNEVDNTQQGFIGNVTPNNIDNNNNNIYPYYQNNAYSQQYDPNQYPDPYQQYTQQNTQQYQYPIYQQPINQYQQGNQNQQPAETNKKPMPKYVKIISIVGKVVMSVFTVMIIFLLVFNLIRVNKVKKGDTLPFVMGYATAVVVSGSMSPTIEIGDLIIIKPQDEYIVGDIITFSKGESYVTHRIVEITDNGFVTKGDYVGNSIDEEKVEISQIKGKVVLKIDKLGKILDFMQTTYGMIITIAVCLGLVLLPDAIPRIVQYFQQTKKE